MDALSLPGARRIALAAQGFDGARRPRARIDAGVASRMISTLGLLQIDSVNVLVRAHYVPLYARLGPYPAALIDDLAYRRRRLFEFWGHEASLIPIEMHPLFRWRMDDRPHPHWVRWAAKHGSMVEAVYQHVVERGPTTLSDLAEPGERAGPWWGWANGKTSLEYLFARGRLTATTRRNFERVYDLTERVIPPAILAVPTPPVADAHRSLIAIAARALGVGTAKDLADYFRLKVTDVRPRIAELVEEGTLRPVRVQGWAQPAYLHARARMPRRVEARALVSPFDQLVWERARTERLFGFRYRIEIYTPAPKRVYGYYVMPFLMNERLAARVDLKADRKASALLVRAAHPEPGVDMKETAEGLAGEVRLMADWLGLERLVVSQRGALAGPLRAALRQSPSEPVGPRR